MAGIKIKKKNLWNELHSGACLLGVIQVLRKFKFKFKFIYLLHRYIWYTFTQWRRGHQKRSVVPINGADDPHHIHQCTLDIYNYHTHIHTSVFHSLVIKYTNTPIYPHTYRHITCIYIAGLDHSSKVSQWLKILDEDSQNNMIKVH